MLTARLWADCGKSSPLDRAAEAQVRVGLGKSILLDASALRAGGERELRMFGQEAAEGEGFQLRHRIMRLPTNREIFAARE